jgi:hypothetical protein
MVLTKSELVASLRDEVRILLHLASKIDRTGLDYRPSRTQRSMLELLRYLSVMGPELAKAAKAGAFDPAVWGSAVKAAETRDFDETLRVIAAQPGIYADVLGAIPDAEYRREIQMFGHPTTRGAFIVRYVLGGHAAYRTQVFLYLKACGHDELATSNLWSGVDAPATV